jgi:hypothetical protein
MDGWMDGWMDKGRKGLPEDNVQRSVHKTMPTHAQSKAWARTLMPVHSLSCLLWMARSEFARFASYTLLKPRVRCALLMVKFNGLHSDTAAHTGVPAPSSPK